MKIIALLTLAAALAVPAAASAATVRQYEGTVVSVNRDHRTFRLHDSERGTVRIKVTGRTRFERIAQRGDVRGERGDREHAAHALFAPAAGHCGHLPGSSDGTPRVRGAVRRTKP